MKNKGYKIVFIVYVLMFLGDLISTLIIRPELIQLLETNPLYRLTGSLLWPVMLNFVVIALLLLLMKGSSFSSFVGIQCMLTVSFLRYFVIKNNLYWYFNPVKHDTVLAIATEAAKTSYYTGIAISTYMIILVGIVSFIFWKLDFKAIRK